MKAVVVGSIIVFKQEENREETQVRYTIMELRLGLGLGLGLGLSMRRYGVALIDRWLKIPFLLTYVPTYFIQLRD